MNDQALVGNSLLTGDAARYLKPKWMLGNGISTEAFDLREGPPPETYVSHFLVRANSQKEIFDQAHLIISGKISDCKKGSIALLEIEEALAEVNDEIEPIIGFVEKGLPHCGLVYLTPRQEKIQEAKATLCFLAKNRLSSVKTIVETATKTAHLKAPD